MTSSTMKDPAEIEIDELLLAMSNSNSISELHFKNRKLLDPYEYNDFPTMLAKKKEIIFILLMFHGYVMEALEALHFEFEVLE